MSREALVEAIKAGDVDGVRALLREHPELAREKRNDVSFLLLSLYAGKPEIAEAFADAGAPLGIHEACALGRVEVAEKLLAEDPARAREVSPDGHSPLGLAAFFGQPLVAMLLVERGADVNLPSANAMKVAPLHSAVARKSRPIVELLLSRGADVNAKQQQGYTALHGAASAGDHELVELLVRAGADKSATSDDGKTPADLARERGYEPVLALLQ